MASLFLYNETSMKNVVPQINKLIKKDQKNIKLFVKRKISKIHYQKTSKEIMREFLKIINIFGFPYKNILSNNIYKASITLALHLNIKDLKKIYKRYIENTNPKKIQLDHKIIFIDKIRVLSGNKQLYGSQYKISKNGKIKILPIKNKKNVGVRRKKMGLISLKKYIESVKINHGKR